MSIKQYFTRFATKVICTISPRRVKRMIFWASIVGHFKIKMSDPNFLVKTNNTLLLSNDVQSLDLPEHLHWMFWDKELIDNTLKKYLISKDSTGKMDFIKNLPNALRYASPKKIERDVDTFVSMLPALA